MSLQINPIEQVLNAYGWWTIAGRARYLGRPTPQWPPTSEMRATSSGEAR